MRSHIKLKMKGRRTNYCDGMRVDHAALAGILNGKAGKRFWQASEEEA
jgi:hypothetical protein